MGNVVCNIACRADLRLWVKWRSRSRAGSKLLESLSLGHHVFHVVSVRAARGFSFNDLYRLS